MTVSIDLRKYNSVVGKKARNKYKGQELLYKIIMELRKK